ncbi:MAG TPA: hypothetical protein PLC53_02275, partial [Bacilli bacterium]|nr:hypothetical protein [Bacilli bacterium]
KALETNYMNKFINKVIEILVERNEDGIIEGHSSNYILVKAVGNKEDINKLIKIKIIKSEYPYLYGNKM